MITRQPLAQGELGEKFLSWKLPSFIVIFPRYVIFAMYTIFPLKEAMPAGRLVKKQEKRPCQANSQLVVRFFLRVLAFLLDNFNVVFCNFYALEKGRIVHLSVSKLTFSCIGRLLYWTGLSPVMKKNFFIWCLAPVLEGPWGGVVVNMVLPGVYIWTNVSCFSCKLQGCK